MKTAIDVLSQITVILFHQCSKRISSLIVFLRYLHTNICHLSLSKQIVDVTFHNYHWGLVGPLSKTVGRVQIRFFDIEFVYSLFLSGCSFLLHSSLRWCFRFIVSLLCDRWRMLTIVKMLKYNWRQKPKQLDFVDLHLNQIHCYLVS